MTLFHPMKNIFRFLTLSAGLLTGAFANATPYKLTFAADTIYTYNIHTFELLPVPGSVINGNFLLNADPAASTNIELLGIDLTINGKKYGIDDVSVEVDPWSLNINGKLDGITTLQLGTDDFTFRLARTYEGGPLIPDWFDYAVVGDFDRDYRSFSTSASITAVPESSTYSLIMAGIAVVLTTCRGRRKL